MGRAASEPYVGPDSTPRAVIDLIGFVGPLTLYRERFNVPSSDPPRAPQYFLARRGHLRNAVNGRLNRRLWSSG